MTSTTSLKIPDSLKARVTAMAAHEGKSAHAYMVEALEEATRLKEERARLVEQADADGRAEGGGDMAHTRITLTAAREAISSSV